MKNLDKAMASLEIRSVASGYRVLAAILARTDAEIRVLEAVPCGSGFAIPARRSAVVALDRATGGVDRCRWPRG